MSVRIQVAILSLIVTVHWSANGVNAQDSTATIAPYLDDAAIAVVAVDLERLDLAGLAEAVGAQSEDSAGQSQARALLEYLQPIVDSVRKQGASDIDAVFSLHDVTRAMPYVIVRASNGEQAAEIARQLRGETDLERRSSMFPSAFVRDNFAIAGNADLEERLDPARIPDRQESLMEALAVAPEAPIRLISVVTDDQRRVLDELLPRLPGDMAGLSIREISDGLKWVTIAIDLQEGSLNGVVGSYDDQKAKALAAALPGFVKGIAALVLDAERDQPVIDMLSSLTAEADGVRVNFATSATDGEQNTAVLLSLLSRIAPVARDVNVRRSLKQLGLAMHNFHGTYDGFPPSASYDESGNPLLSWRVYVLPYLEQGELYRQFHLDEPWDSPHNRPLIDKMPDVFATEHFDLNIEGKTTLQLPIGEETAFHGQKGIAIRDMIDGTSNTLMVLDVPREQAVIWTRPEDFNVDQPDLRERLFGGRDSFRATLFDGSMRAIAESVDDETIRKLLTYNGEEVIGEF